MAEESQDTPNKVAVITGASSGIGTATAQEFAKAGYHVVLAARRKKELEKVAAECEQQGVKSLVVTTEVTDDKAVHKLCEQAVAAFGRIDVWVNNAGVYLTGKFEDVPLEDMRRIMDTNFFGTIHGSHAALGQFRLQGNGVLINLSSVNAAAPQPYVSIYSASKAAVRAFDEALRMELRSDGLQNDIHVCTVMPASIDTNLFQNSANYTGKEIHAPEPVYEPERVAKQIVALAHHPQREVIVGEAGKLMAYQNAHMPETYEKQITSYTEKSLLGELGAPTSEGNLRESIEDNQGVHGGWSEKRLRGDTVNKSAGIGVAALIASMAGVGYLLVKGRKRTSFLHSLHHR